MISRKIEIEYDIIDDRKTDDQTNKKTDKYIMSRQGGKDRKFSEEPAKFHRM